MADTIELSEKLAEYRAQIDAIDDEIIALIRKRTAIAKQVGMAKAAHVPEFCPLRPSREAAQMKRIAEAFEGSGFAPAAAVHIWRHMINASLMTEGAMKISVYAPNGQADLYWLAREYFGAYTPIVKEPNARRIIGDVTSGKATIGVLPYPTGDDAAMWWPELMQSRDRTPTIFARLPYMETEPGGLSAASGLVVANVVLEEMQDCVTLLGMITDSQSSLHRLQEVFKQAALEVKWIAAEHQPGDLRFHLIEAQVFVTREDAALKKVEAALDIAVDHLFVLGSYAKPLFVPNHYL